MEQEESPQTLDEVYSKFNVEQAAQEFQAKPQQQPVPQAPVSIPDPTLDADGFKKWGEHIQTQDQQLRQTLYSVNERLEKWEQERIRGQEEADLKAAVSAVKEKVGDFDEDFLEVALAHRARKDDKFMNLWQNRSKKPEAWKAALGVVANDLAKKFSVKQDPQLAENQRAMKVSRDQMATTQKPDKNATINEAINEHGFDRVWEYIKEGRKF